MAEKGGEGKISYPLAGEFVAMRPGRDSKNNLGKSRTGTATAVVRLLGVCGRGRHRRDGPVEGERGRAFKYRPSFFCSVCSAKATNSGKLARRGEVSLGHDRAEGVASANDRLRAAACWRRRTSCAAFSPRLPGCLG